MATRAEIRTAVDALMGADPQVSTAEINAAIQLRYSHVYEAFHWSRRLRDFTLSLVAQVESGTSDTVTATNGSATVTSAGTPFTVAMDGRQVQLGDERQYFFLTYVSTSEITLQDGEGNSVTWPGTTASGLSWRVFKSIYPLPATAEAVLSLGGDLPIEEYDGGRAALDVDDPERSSTANQPRYWLYAGESSSNVKEIEVWPVPTQARILRGQMLRKAPTLEDATETGLNLALMSWATAADLYNMLYAKTGDEPYQRLGLFYERKYQEVDKDFKPLEIERTSPVRTLRQGSRSKGSDWYVTHLEDHP